MIRHASLDPATAISFLAITMVEPPFGALLVPAVGASSLADPCKLLAVPTTVALAAITTDAEKELGAAFAVPTRTSSEATVQRRHSR
jgi:hypothetical protein